MQQLLKVEVYLPKNMRNYGALVALLSEALEFTNAKRWLLNQAETLYNMDMLLFDDLPAETANLLEARNATAVAEFFQERGWSLSHPVSIEQEHQVFWLREANAQRFFLQRAKPGDRWAAYLATVWKQRAGAYTGGRVGSLFQSREAYQAIRPYRTGWSLDDFKRFLQGMEKTIFGYSIYEADGAFQSEGVGKPVPVSGWHSFDTALLQAIRATDGARVLELLSQEHYLAFGQACRLDPHCKSYLRNGLASGTLVSFLTAKGFDLPPRCSLRKLSPGNWELTASEASGRDHKRITLQCRPDHLFAFSPPLDISSGPGDAEHFLTLGEKRLLVRKTDTGAEVAEVINLLEERTCVIRFLADLVVGPDGPPVLQDTLVNPELGNPTMSLAAKRLWDTIGFLGFFFVYNLGARVGIEDEIWMVFDSGLLWAWKKGQVLRASIDPSVPF